MDRVVMIMHMGYAIAIALEYNGGYYRCTLPRVVKPIELEDYWIGVKVREGEFDINIYKLDDKILRAALYPVENQKTVVQRGTSLPLEIL